MAKLRKYKRWIIFIAVLVLAVVSVIKPEYAENVSRAFMLIIAGAQMKYAMVITFFAACLAGAYYLGRSHAELKIVKEKVEVIKYVSKLEQKIYSRPNDDFNAIYKRMREQRQYPN